MKRIVVPFLLCFCLFYVPLSAGADDGVFATVKPSFNAGFAFADQTDMHFRALDGSGLSGANDLLLRFPELRGKAITGEIPFALTDRLIFSFVGRWSFPSTDETLAEQYNNSTLIGRNWRIDEWDHATLDILLSYVFFSDESFSAAALAGFRIDRQFVALSHPAEPARVLSSASDIVDFRMNTYAPLVGLAATYKGLKSGSLTGDITAGIIGSSCGYGNMEFLESFGGVRGLAVDSDLDGTEFYTLFGEVTMLSGRIGPKVTTSLGLYASYTKYFIDDTVLFVTVPATAEKEYEFNFHSDVATVGLKGAIAF
jgi:hypothetical protein